MNNDQPQSEKSKRRQVGPAPPEMDTAAFREAFLPAIGEGAAIPAQECLGEQALQVREETVRLREEAVQRREMKVLQREREARQGQSGKSEQDELNAKLKQANEHLVIASVQSQSLAEELEKSKAVMTHWAHHDFLTSLPNRMQLYDRIAQAIALARRHDTKLALLFMDLDRFKIVNDTLGHAIGDKLLQAVAQRLKSAMRSTDTVSRQGGDEFVLLLSEVSHEDTLVMNVEKIHQIVTAPYDIAGHELHIGATIGVSIFPQDGEDTETLIRHADDAMYYAKEVGRNKYQFFNHEMRAREMERQHLEASLYHALEQRQFVLFYQAQVDLESGAITGAEALIRWHHASRGLILPAGFVPVAEDCGAIVPIGRWVLREACRQAQSWLDDGLSLNVIAVNISAREFENDDFLEHVCAVLQETGLAPDHLELELTETVLMKSIESTAATLHDLRSIGVRISIDDFGTGYSSLSYLKRFPIDTMKIDQSFVRDISTGADDILVNAVIGIGKNLRHQVIAEGVETPAQLAFLRANHCTAVQGFYLNPPMIAHEFASVLRYGVAAHVLN
jgi:diguanylate cyclase